MVFPANPEFNNKIFTADISANEGNPEQLEVKQLGKRESEEVPTGEVVPRPMECELPCAEEGAPREHEGLDLVQHLLHGLVSHVRGGEPV